MTVYWPNGSLTMPRVTSEFNAARKNPVTGIVQPHNGIDLVGWADNCSPVDGTVIFAGYNGGAGNEVRIRADGPTAFHVGDVFRILHHASLYVKTGQRVTARQPVGRMGTTGNSTGVHCHFETHEYRLGNPINPRDFMRRANASPAGGGSTPGEDDMPYSPEEIKKLFKDALIELKGNDGRNVLDGVIQARADVTGVQEGVNDAGGKVWRNPLTNPLTGQPMPAKDFLRYLPHHHRDIILEVRALNVANLAKLSDAQLDAYATAVVAEQAKRLSS